MFTFIVPYFIFKKLLLKRWYLNDFLTWHFSEKNLTIFGKSNSDNTLYVCSSLTLLCFKLKFKSLRALGGLAVALSCVW